MDGERPHAGDVEAAFGVGERRDLELPVAEERERVGVAADREPQIAMLGSVGEPAAHAVATLLVRHGARRVVVSSFNPVALRVVHETAPAVRTALLTTAAFDLASNLAGAVDGGHDECHVPAQILDEPFVREAHATGKRVVAWTVDDPELLRTFAGWGVDWAAEGSTPRPRRRIMLRMRNMVPMAADPPRSIGVFIRQA